MFDHDIASIYCVGRFKDENLSLLIRRGSMLYTTWNDHEFTRPHLDNMTSNFSASIGSAGLATSSSAMLSIPFY